MEKEEKAAEAIVVDSVWLSGQEESVIGVFYEKIPIGHVKRVICYQPSTGRLLVRRACRTRNGVVFVDTMVGSKRDSLFIVGFVGLVGNGMSWLQTS